MRFRVAKNLLLVGYSLFGLPGGIVAEEPPADSPPTLRIDFEQAPETFDLHGLASIQANGPTSTDFHGMPTKNQALELRRAGAYLRIADEPTFNFDFELGDAITLEAWVRVDEHSPNSYAYIIGKGRTYESSGEGSLRENQNYALRLLNAGGEARLSFLFSTATADGSQYHRWNSTSGFAVADGGGWHHVAVSYQFGQPESICGYVDGKRVQGKWDMGGPTLAAPIQDDDAIWIGSSRAGDPGNSLVGGVDDVRIHRFIISPEAIADRRRVIERQPEWPGSAARGQVTITLHEQASAHQAFPAGELPESFGFSAPAMCVHRLPLKFIRGGIRELWDGPVLMRAFVSCEFPGGEVEFLLRSPGLARLWVDGQSVVETPAHRLRPDAHQPFEVFQSDLPWLRVPRSGVRERRAIMTLSPGEHAVVLETLVGSQSTRCEPNETLAAFRQGDSMFQVLRPASSSIPAAPLHLVDRDIEEYLAGYEADLQRLDRQLLTEASDKEVEFWQQRHRLARESLTTWPILTTVHEQASEPNTSAIDALLYEGLADSGLSAEEIAVFDRPLSDGEFLRRASLDTRGVPPSRAELNAFLTDCGDSASTLELRSRMIEQFVTDERWADHWTSYWQDVLAENPNILKPSLNNTGPFRLWIHDALLLNKPMDRFVTELVRMEGSLQGGGPKGFEMAAENDVPMAEKAHVVASAFLSVDLKCARCHDAPYHPWKQRELFSIAALLEQKPIVVPETSSVPAAFFDRRGGDSPIEITLRPGELVQPMWPETLLPVSEFGQIDVPTNLLGRDDSPRERLAAMLTRGENRRFAQTIVNRVWTRLMGWGLVSHVDDWNDANVRQPEVLDYLTRQFVDSGYDMHALTRLIMNSRIYQRQAIDSSGVSRELQFAAPWQRRLTAEQLVDSMHYVTGVELATEPLTFDAEGSQDVKNFLNLGIADRAWKLASLSNERDRPSLNLPKAAAVVGCLEAFGWRSSRQSPVTHRETDANLVQPGVMGNGHVTGWTSRLSDSSQMTVLAIAASSVDDLVEDLFKTVLSRSPSPFERATFVNQLSPGFDKRIVEVDASELPPPPNRGFVTWSNHFAVEANELARDLAYETAAGPSPTRRLSSDWRERAEDAIWALLNAPEFQLVP